HRTPHAFTHTHRTPHAFTHTHIHTGPLMHFHIHIYTQQISKQIATNSSPTDINVRSLTNKRKHHIFSSFQTPFSASHGEHASSHQTNKGCTHTHTHTHTVAYRSMEHSTLAYLEPFIPI